jgi:hypothetical protein
MESLPSDVLETIAKKTDAVSVAKLKCSCTKFNGEDMRKIEQTFCKEATKSMFENIIASIKGCEAIRNNPVVSREFMIGYLKTMIDKCLLEHRANVYSQTSMHFMLIRDKVEHELNVNSDIATIILCMLAGVKTENDFQQYVHQCPRALQIIQELIIQEVTIYDIKISSHKLFAYIRLKFLENTPPIIKISFHKSSLDIVEKHQKHLLDMKDILKSMEDGLDNMVNNHQPQVNDIGVPDDSDSDEPDEQSSEEDDPDEEECERYNNKIKHILQFIPSAQIENYMKIIFDATESNLNGLVDLIHDKCGHDVCINSFTNITLTSVWFSKNNYDWDTWHPDNRMHHIRLFKDHLQKYFNKYVSTVNLDLY